MKLELAAPNTTLPPAISRTMSGRTSAPRPVLGRLAAATIAMPITTMPITALA